MWYFDDVFELKSLRYNFRRDRQLNRNVESEKDLVNDDEGDADDDDDEEDDDEDDGDDADGDDDGDDDEEDDDDEEEEDPYAFYPTPVRRAIEYEDFEW